LRRRQPKWLQDREAKQWRACRGVWNTGSLWFIWPCRAGCSNRSTDKKIHY
jgi:hypothetical protein